MHRLGYQIAIVKCWMIQRRDIPDQTSQAQQVRNGGNAVWPKRV